MPRPAKKSKTEAPAAEAAAASLVKRLEPGPRMSEASIFGNLVFLAGQVANGDEAKVSKMDIKQQTKAVLSQIDDLLAKAGTDKKNILRAQIFLTDISEFAGMNSVWDAWVATGNTPSRATVQAVLAKPHWKIEIVVTAGIPAA